MDRHEAQTGQRLAWVSTIQTTALPGPRCHADASLVLQRPVLACRKLFHRRLVLVRQLRSAARSRVHDRPPLVSRNARVLRHFFEPIKGQAVGRSVWNTTGPLGPGYGPTQKSPSPAMPDGSPRPGGIMGGWLCEQSN